MSSESKHAEQSKERLIDVIDLSLDDSGDEADGMGSMPRKQLIICKSSRRAGLGPRSAAVKTKAPIACAALTETRRASVRRLPLDFEEFYKLESRESSTHGVSALYYPAMHLPFDLGRFYVVCGQLPNDAIAQLTPNDNWLPLPQHAKKYRYSLEISRKTAPETSLFLPIGYSFDPTIDVHSNPRCAVERRALLMYRRSRGFMLNGKFWPELQSIKLDGMFPFDEEQDVYLECNATIRRENNVFTIRLESLNDPACWLILRRDTNEHYMS